MNILILGGGGREHALAWAVLQNPKCDRLIVAPGNAGIAALAECAALDILDGEAVAAFAAEQAVDLVIVGPEAPLVAGVADVLRAQKIAVFGPSAAAAQLEGSKTFTKTICDAAGAPTARWRRFDALAPAVAWVQAEGAPIVVKADGLAAGKGVTVAASVAEATKALGDLFGGAFGDGDISVVVEECMNGEEASLFFLVDGDTIVALGTAQDHKRAFDGDRGPNTGGMGAYSPAPCVTPAIAAQIMDEIVAPTMKVMAERGAPYSGLLFAGVMIAEGRARLIEYNARFGDPECQVLMMRLGAQALDLIQACAEGRLAQVAPTWADDHALTVVLAAPGYPDAPEKGSIVRGLATLPEDSHHMVFHAGTAMRDGQVIATGGRVLAATARGATLAEAHARAYDLAARIDWPEGVYRRDIGHRAL